MAMVGAGRPSVSAPFTVGPGVRIPFRSMTASCSPRGREIILYAIVADRNQLRPFRGDVIERGIRAGIAAEMRAPRSGRSSAIGLSPEMTESASAPAETKRG